MLTLPLRYIPKTALLLINGESLGEVYKMKNAESLAIDYFQRFYLWSHKGSNLGPPDYESGALTN